MSSYQTVGSAISDRSDTFLAFDVSWDGGHVELFMYGIVGVVVAYV